MAMLTRFINLNPYFAEGSSGALSIADAIEQFGLDDDPSEQNDKVLMDSLVQDLEEKKEEEKEDKKDKKDKQEKGEEEKPEDKKEEDEELKEEDLELTTVPRRQEILKAYPDIFKKFPALNNVLYREKEYTEVFGSVEDAKDIKDRAETFDRFEGEVLNGNIGAVFHSLKDADNEAFASMINNIMPALYKEDQSAYFHIVGDTLKRSLQTAFQGGNEDLKKAANAVYNYFFQGQQFQLGQFGKPKQQDSDKDKIDEERQALQQERFDSAQTELTSRIGNSLRNVINEVIDRNSQMTDYVRRNAVNDVLGELDDVIANDPRFTKIKDSLWEKAFEDGFSNQSTAKIRNAIINYAKSIAPGIIRKVRSEALKGQASREDNTSTRKSRDVADKIDEKPAKSSSSKRTDGLPELKTGMRSVDYLMAD